VEGLCVPSAKCVAADTSTSLGAAELEREREARMHVRSPAACGLALTDIHSGACGAVRVQPSTQGAKAESSARKRKRKSASCAMAPVSSM
jgi:hypothetical protein